MMHDGCRHKCQIQYVVVTKCMVGHTSVIDHLTALPLAGDLQTEHKGVFLTCSLLSCRTKLRLSDHCLCSVHGSRTGILHVIDSSEDPRVLNSNNVESAFSGMRPSRCAKTSSCKQQYVPSRGNTALVLAMIALARFAEPCSP